MTNNLISLLIFLASILVLSFIVKRKIAVLAEISAVSSGKGIIKKKTEEFFSRVSSAVKNFPTEMLLQKVLSKIRILTLKLENKTGNCLSRMRQKALIKRNNLASDYWQKLKDKKKQGKTASRL